MTRTITLSDGKKIPALGWGNGSGGLGRNPGKAQPAGLYALKAGIHHIDTAQIYETEEAASSTIKESGLDKKDIWVTTKIGKQGLAIDPKVIRENVQSSLDKLGFKPDLYLVHNPFVPEAGKGNIAKFWTILEDLVKDGTLEGVSLGVSNFRPQDLKEVLEVATIKPVANQLEYHPYTLSHIQPVLDICAENNITIESYGPLTPLLRHPTGGPIKPILERIATRLSKEAGKTVPPSSVLLLWTIQKGVVAVSTSGKEENIKTLAEVDGLPDLTQDEIKEIEETGRKVHFRHYREHMEKDFPLPDLPKDL
ncbi:hypothetical protein CI109_102346 [Kwoniella shandongensis]|uniref:NADP-dependent oxidoreductase domain-containing protein n=1 Tax=Kwoniella shandongensis TaxID=1734106 RepID=A0A5M6C4L9_9TREE|nr:uncharacterized protein CI109_003335 [Kwoniella shandongensis]KAA5528435.1 hypothetical protein CI109_003335 [Kwoniella shandongensis]